MILGSIVMGLVGLLCIVQGLLLRKKQKIDLLHDYHRDKVSEENKAAFCSLTGLGLLLMGAGILISALALALTESLWSFLGFGIGFLTGLGCLISAGKTYNK